ncbi:hypothetical protein [Streptomyces sp. NBC_00568]|uniref:hypothetical protein n=1 Tax=Streptomyces sp. NBC_00568 TaxID=2975779 RepID=UPI002255ED84|nr:hypothetical protein [Streptomyces sp. NBC_00568]MCX4993772.1 hypothetical protein [Streptomyces sp. NBC_00568]
MAFTVPRMDVCFVCLPGGPHTPPPCTVCGRSGFFFHQGLCTACHPCSPERRDACPDCYAWGTSAASRWRCWGCLAWHRKFSRKGPGGPCTWCQRPVAVNQDRVCRMCWLQRARLRRATGNLHLSYAAALEDGWVQLSFANTRPQERRPARAGSRPPLGGRPAESSTAEPSTAASPAALVPFGHRQLILFEPPPRRFAAAGGLPRDLVLAAWLDQELAAWASSRGWSRSTLARARRGLRILLAVQDTPGAPVPVTLIDQLAATDVPTRLLQEFLTARGFTEDDRTPAIDAWFTRNTAHLPEPMAGQLAHWLALRLHGNNSRPPRSRPRSAITVRHQLLFALPVLTRLADSGIRDLADVTAGQLRTRLAACRLTGSDHTHTASGLRAVFTALAAQRIIASNPAVHLRVGTPAPTIPLPADLAPIRQALTSPDPARAAVTALLAFHAVRASEIRGLTLDDARRSLGDGLLSLPGRTVRLAQPVRVRLAAYLTHRSQRWPHTANPYFFVTHRSALSTGPVSRPWLYRHYPASSHLLRDDRIIDEAQTSADARIICELFGLTFTPPPATPAPTGTQPSNAGKKRSFVPQRLNG